MRGIGLRGSSATGSHGSRQGEREEAEPQVMARAVRSDLANRDLLRILITTAVERSLGSADRLLTRIERKTELYARLPMTGILRADLAPDLRCFVVRPYLVFYRPISNGIEVARVIHGAREIGAERFAPRNES